MEQTLIFVYNADSGLFNLLADTAHKALSPGTYACNLCRITHTLLGATTEWKRYLRTRSLTHDLEFLHRDQLADRYGLTDQALPAIYVRSRSGEGLSLLVGKAEIDDCHSVVDLKAVLESTLRSAGMADD